MTTYSPYCRYAAAPKQWCGSNGFRFATREEAQDYLDAIIDRPDLLETRIIELPWKPTHTWVEFADGSGGDAQPRGHMHPDDLRRKSYKNRQRT